MTKPQTKTTGYNSTYDIGGVSWLLPVPVQAGADSLVVKQTLVFQIKFCGESPALRVAANR